jgi:hypothetical protein
VGATLRPGSEEGTLCCLLNASWPSWRATFKPANVFSPLPGLSYGLLVSIQAIYLASVPGEMSRFLSLGDNSRLLPSVKESPCVGFRILVSLLVFRAYSPLLAALTFVCPWGRSGISSRFGSLFDLPVFR